MRPPLSPARRVKSRQSGNRTRANNRWPWKASQRLFTGDNLVTPVRVFRNCIVLSAALPGVLIWRTGTATEKIVTLVRCRVVFVSDVAMTRFGRADAGTVVEQGGES